MSLIKDFEQNIINLLERRVCFFVCYVINEKIWPPLNDFYELKFHKYIQEIMVMRLKYRRQSFDMAVYH